MRNAKTVLSVIEDRGKRVLPIDDVYRQLFNPNLYLLAYSRIYKNDGAMTQGVTKETADGMSLNKIENIIEDIRYERFRWTPVRRINIPKKNGKTRPLGIPTWKDKLVQEVIRLILEAYYEPQFKDSSHGFRPKRGCHTALTIGKRSINGIIGLRMPASFVKEKCSLYMRNGKPIHRPELINDDDFTIVNIYQSEYRGYVQFYSLAQNIAWLGKLHWVMWSSLMKTLACKYKTSVAEL